MTDLIDDMPETVPADDALTASEPHSLAPVLLDYIGTETSGANPRSPSARPLAHQLAPVVVSGWDTMLHGGLNVVDGAAWAIVLEDHAGIAGMVAAGDIVVMLALPRRQPDVIALVARTYCPAGLAALEARENERTTPRAAIVAALAKQRTK